MANTKQNSRVTDCPLMEDNFGGHPAGRILPVAVSLTGTLVKVQTKENKLFEGIFRAFSPKFEIALEVTHQILAGHEDELPRRSMVHDKVLFKLEDIVKIEGTPDLESVVKTGFATDSEISGANNGSAEHFRELEPWEPDAGTDDVRFSPENNGPLADGWSVQDMFLVNENRFSVKSDYDEKLYSTAELNIDPACEADQEKVLRASQLAREIERNPASKRAAELENDDEERDIVVKSSGSSANNSAATTPTSTSTSGAPSRDRFAPPNKRGGGPSDRGGRGSRRGGGGAHYQSSMRHQTGGEMRSARGGPGREYSDSGTYPVGSSYYQRQHRFNQPHHHHHPPPLMAQTSHERSPAMPGGHNEWERNRGPKRQDVREGFPGGPPSLPPQPSGPVATARQMQPLGPLPPRQPVDGPPTNGRGRNMKLDDLRKFGKDFQLAPDQPSNVGPTQAPGGIQSGRMPPQSSPTQQQMSAQPSAVPPPHHQQRRSPELRNQPGQAYSSVGAPGLRHQHPHSAQNQKLPQASPVQPPPQRMMASNEALLQGQYQHQHPAMAQHPPTDYAHAANPHHQPQRPGHPTVLVVQGGQANNGGPPSAPKIHQIPGHVQQMQQMVVTQPPPPVAMNQTQPPPPQTPQQSQQQQTLQQQGDNEQRNAESANEAVKKSKLNPEAAEFRPQLFRQGSSASTAAAGPAGVMSNQGIGNYPVQVQSPPQSLPPGTSSAVYGGMAGPAMTPVANQAGYMGGAVSTYQQQQAHSSSSMSVHIVPGSTPLYTIQAAQPAAVAIFPNNATYRPRAAIAGAPQPAVAAATGQPIMASPYTPAGPYVLHYNANVNQQAAPHPGAPAATAYQPNQTYVLPTHRMLPPQYVMPQAAGNGDQSQQQYYAAAVPVGLHSYPQAASVSAISVAPSGPPSTYQQQQASGNTSHSQTPPTSQQQPGNPSPAAGPPPPPSNSSSVSGNGPANQPGAVMAYPPSAPTPQSPQYPTGPGGAYQAAPGQPYAVFPTPGYMATAAGNPQLYGSQAGLAPGAVHIQGAPTMHQGYQAGPQAHFAVLPEYAAQQYVAAAAAAQQAAVAAAQQQQQQMSSGYHPAVFRSSSVPSFGPGGPAASGQGAPASISHQNNHA